MSYNRRLLDYDPLTRVQTWHDYDPVNDRTIIETVQDVEPWIEQSKRLQNDDDYRNSGIKRSWMHLGSIPNAISMKWLVEEGININKRDHWPAVIRKLHDPDYRFLRTARGNFLDRSKN